MPPPSDQSVVQWLAVQPLLGHYTIIIVRHCLRGFYVI